MIFLFLIQKKKEVNINIEDDTDITFFINFLLLEKLIQEKVH